MRQPVSRLCSGSSVLVVLALAVPFAAFAQRTRQDYPVQSFRILEYPADLGFKYDYWREEQNGGRIRFSNNTFQEYFEIRPRGYVYHPRLLDFRTRLRFGLTQQRIRRSGSIDGNETIRESDFFDEYEIYLQFLKEHPVSTTLFATKEERPVLGLFTDVYTVKSETYGGRINWDNDFVPMYASYSHNELKEFGASSRSDTDTDVFQYVARNSYRERILSEFRYQYQEFRQNYRSQGPVSEIRRKTDTDTHTANFFNTIYFDDARRSNLHSIIRYQDQSGTSDFDTFSWLERLRLQHHDKLFSYYEGSYLRNDSNSRKTETWRGEAGLEHILYQSLTSHFDVHGRWTDFDEREENLYGVTGRVDYRKDTAWGFLSAGYGRTYDKVENLGDTARVQVLDEQLTLNTGFPSFLTRINVIPESIFVTDLDNLEVFDEGFDYEVVEVSGRTGLQIIPGGRLVDGDPVLVDYDVLIEGDIEYKSDFQNFNVRHDFDRIIPGLALYYRWQDLNARDIQEETGGRQILEYTRHVAGLRYDWRTLTWTEEYESYDSNFDGYDQIRSQLAGSHQLSDWLRWNWNAGMNYTMYDEEFENTGDDDSTFWYAATQLTGPIRRLGFWSLEARGEDESGRVERRVLGFLGKVGLQWRKVHFDGGARLEYYDYSETDSDRMHLFVEVRRELW